MKGTGDNLRVLGVGWNPVQGTVVFEVTINFSKKRKGVYTGPNLEKADMPQALPLVLTRGIVLGQVIMIFDPLGFVCPFTLLGKIYLQEHGLRSLAGMISCLLNSAPSGSVSSALCLILSTSVWTVAYDHQTHLVNHG